MKLVMENPDRHMLMEPTREGRESKYVAFTGSIQIPESSVLDVMKDVQARKTYITSIRGDIYRIDWDDPNQLWGWFESTTSNLA